MLKLLTSEALIRVYKDPQVKAVAKRYYSRAVLWRQRGYKEALQPDSGLDPRSQVAAITETASRGDGNGHD
jgi:hypothetical protein